MRIFITKTDTDLTALRRMLLSKPEDASATLDRLRALNPQVDDFQHLATGTVLILPDSPEIKAGVGMTVGASNVSDLADDFAAGLKAVSTRFATRVDELHADHDSLTAALETAVVKRLVESNPAMAQQVKAADAQFDVDQKFAAASRSQIEELRAAALAEFARLQKILEQ